MRNIARLPKRDREALFRNTADKMVISFAIAEKDFWVSYILDYLFTQNQWKEHFAFKGGTSLSKAYGLIERFSEDVDLILDWRKLGFEINEPLEKRSKTKQNELNLRINKLTEKFLEQEFLPVINEDIQKDLDEQSDLMIDSNDGQTVLFQYPSDQDDSYIKPIVRLEIGALAAWSPASWRTITPYAAEQYPQLFEQKNTKAFTVEPKRTFWEKATILHQEAHRSVDTEVRQRHSRHYYDFYQMCRSEVKTDAYKDLGLLNDVIHFKKQFYPCAWANYDRAIVGSIKLIPAIEHIPGLKRDYIQMENMIFGDIPKFDSLLDSLRDTEKEINRLTK